MRLASHLELYMDSTGNHDSIVMKSLINGWLPIWKASGKSNYKKLSLRNMDIMYDKMIPSDIETRRINRCVRRQVDHQMMATDDYCEMVNDYLKKISTSNNVKIQVNKSLFISLIRRYMHNMGPKSIRKDKD